MKTILIVDDSPEGQGRLAAILGPGGYKVIAVPGGAAALSILRNDVQVDLVITEYQIPDMDGIAFVASVKTFFPNLPVIVVASFSSIEAYIKTLSLGVFDYMNKPVNDRELRTAVQSALGTHPPGNAFFIQP